MKDRKPIHDDWETWQGEKNKQMAKYRAEVSAASRGGKKCSDCGLYGCVCQITLPEIELKLKLLGTTTFVEKMNIVRKWKKKHQS